MTLDKAVLKALHAMQADPKGVRRATVYLSSDLVVKFSRLRPRSLRDRSETLVFTVGKPNYRERLFVKMCVKAGEPFPVKKVQLTPWPKKRGAK